MRRGEAWTEPARRLPLRWGTYEGRYLAGMLYIVGGVIVLDGSNTYTVPFLLVGTAAHVTGWQILPFPGLRRLAVVGPAVATQWLLLTGPQSLWFMAIPFLGWLFVRERPFRSYPTVIIVIAVGIALSNTFHSAHNEPVAYAIESVAVVGSAWLARAIATTRNPFRQRAAR